MTRQESHSVRRLRRLLDLSYHAMAKVGYVRYSKQSKRYVMTKKGRRKLRQLKDVDGILGAFR